MSDEREIILNRKDRRTVASIKQKIARQNAKILNKYKDRIAELKDSTKVDWSLFNMVLERLDFTECKNSLESMHKLYSGMWGYIAKVTRDNYNMRALFAKYCFDDLGNLNLEVSEEDMVIIGELFSNEGDPLAVSREALEEVRRAAEKRATLARKGIVTPPKPRIIT